MKAITFSEFGDPEVLKLSEVPSPKPQKNELLIKVHATALNRADILQRKGRYGVTADMPAILGLEIAGEVVERGADVHDFQKGERVFGLVSGGGYAEYCCIDSQMAIRLPEYLTYEEAAAIPEAFLTAEETLFQLGQLKSGDSVLIHAAGSGVGTTAVQMAHHIGAKVFATAGSDGKIARVKKIGADYVFNYKTQNFVQEILALTAEQGVDVIEDFVGANYFAEHLKLLKATGRLIIIGFMSGAKVEMDLSMVLAKRLQIKGSILRTRSLTDKRSMTERLRNKWLPLIRQCVIFPVVDRVYSIHDVVQAHEYMEQNLNFGKIVLQCRIN